jgi:ferredoxin
MEIVKEVEITFEREGLHGIVAEGTYISDAAKRFGIRQTAPCVPAESEHHCTVHISAGGNLLSPPTETERNVLGSDGEIGDRRLGCQTRFDRSGEVVIMTTETKTAEPESETSVMSEEEYMKAFGEMPLDKKISNLVKLEAMALSDTLNYIANSPYTVVEKVMDVLAGFGFKMHEQEKAAARPKEHVETATANGTPAAGMNEDDDSIVDAEIPI